MKQKLPEGIPQPPEGYIYYGRGPLKKQQASYDIACLFDGMWRTNRKGDCTYHYAIRAGTELARLNGLEDGWQKVSDVGWPKVSDYPVWVWHPELGMGFAGRGYTSPTTRPIRDMDQFSAEEDYKITHWQRCPITKPEPPVEETSEAQNRIKAAERKLEEAKRELEQARKAL